MQTREQEISSVTAIIRSAWKKNPELSLGELITSSLPPHCDGNITTVTDREIGCRLFEKTLK